MCGISSTVISRQYTEGFDAGYGDHHIGRNCSDFVTGKLILRPYEQRVGAGLWHT